MRDLPDNQRVYMSTGSQGEPMAVLARIANKSHPKISVGGGGLFLLRLLRSFPATKTPSYRLINGLMKLGAHVVHQGNAKIHVSGHAAQGELLYCYNILKPAYALPIHGEVRHQVANAESP